LEPVEIRFSVFTELIIAAALAVTAVRSASPAAAPHGKLNVRMVRSFLAGRVQETDVGAVRCAKTPLTG